MPVITKTWLGGGNNAASNPNDWTPTGAPLPGEQLDIESGTINIAGNALAGDALTLAYSGVTGSVVNINTSDNATLDLAGGLSRAVSVSVNVAGQLNLTDSLVYTAAGTLRFIGGSINVVGTNTFEGVTFDSNLTGNGTIDANHGGDGGVFGPTVFNGSVGSGVTVALEAFGPPEFVQIDHPSSFNGKIVLPAAQPFIGNVTLEGLHVTSADLIASSDVLQMWNGKHLVDTVRLGGDTNNLVVQQTASGVVLTRNDTDQHIVGNLFH
jgi:hypothetical protein